MAKLIKLTADNYLDSSSVSYNKIKLSEILNLIGSCAVLEKTDFQNVAASTITIVQFNNLKLNDNNIIRLNSDGSFTILKDITRILITLNIRGYGTTGIIFYMNGDNGGFNSVTETTSSGTDNFVNGSGIIEVSKGSTYKLQTYFYANGIIQGYDRNWCGLNITVLK